MSDDILRTIYIDTDLESYRNYFSDDWRKRIDVLTSPAPKLSEITFDITLEWRAAAYAASLPALIPDHVKEYHDSFVNTGEINTTLLQIAQGVTAKLASRVPEVTSDHALVRRLQTEIVKLAAEIEDARVGTKIEFPLDKMWNEYLEERAYKLGLWGSQRIAYVSIYNSYENFIAQVVRIARSLDRCRTGDDAFKKHMSGSFGDTLKEKCWTEPRLHIARLARHSLSHAGGRVTKELADVKPNHGFVVVDGRIQITPGKIKALLALLKDCVYTLAQEAVTMPEFK